MQIKFNKEEFDVIQFNEYIGPLSEKISGYRYEQSNLTVYLDLPLTPEELQELKTKIESFTPTTIYPLRIYRVVSEEYDHEYIKTQVDFSILGFRKMSPSYHRGKKLQAIYKCPNKDEIIVEKIFEDVRDEDGILTGLQVTFNWYSEANEVKVSKTEIVKAFNKYEAETEERKRRYRQFDYLRASVKGTPNEYYISIIINYFSIAINKYQDDGILDLNQEMIDILNTDLSTLSADDQVKIGTIQQILLGLVPRNDGLGNTTVQKSIQYQMGIISLEEL